MRAIDDLLQRLEEAVARGDPEALAALLCREVSAVFSGTSEPVRGREAVLATWKRHMAQWSEVRIARRHTVVRIHSDVAWGSFMWDGEGPGGWEMLPAGGRTVDGCDAVGRWWVAAGADAYVHALSRLGVAPGRRVDDRHLFACISVLSKASSAGGKGYFIW